jgi:Ca2+-binding EF-hand superfamily protein
MATFSPNELEEIKKTFRSFDKNNDGHITMEELEQVMKQCGQNPTKLEVKLLMNQVDKDHNGKITMDEFCDYMANPPRHRYAEDDLRGRFEIFDKDGDGFITKPEMTEIVAELELGAEFPVEVIESIFEEADVNHDGKISYQEFCSAMR